MEAPLVAAAETVAMGAYAPQTKSTGPKTSTNFSALSNKNSKEAPEGEAEGLQATVQTQTLAQTQIQTQKDSTDSVEPPDRQEVHHKGSHASTLGGHGPRGPQLRGALR